MAASVTEFTNVCFNSMIEEEINAPVATAVSVASTNKVFTYSQVMQIADSCEKRGFSECAVVVARGATIWPAKLPSSWGIVINVRRFVGMVPYKPLTIRWVGKEGSTEHWPDELYLIHEGLNASEVEKTLKEQEDHDVGAV